VTSKNLIALCVFVLAAAFYVFTLLPSAAWGDGIKLQSEAIAGESFVLAEMPPDRFAPDPYPFSKVGVAAWDHPLYIVVGHLLVCALPQFDPLWVVNLVSAVFGAATVALVFLLSHRLTDSIFASGFCALALAVSHTFWWHSSTPEVYTLFMFLLVGSFYFFDRFEESGRAFSLALAALLWGLAASTHILAFLAVPALGLYYLISGRSRPFYVPGRWELVLATLAFLAGFSLYMVQFVRMLANFPLSELLGPVVGTTFLNRLLTLSPTSLGESIITYVLFLTVQFSPVGIVLGIAGIRRVLRDGDRSLRKIIAFFLVFALFGIFYRVTDQFTFFLPSYVFWALLIGIGTEQLLRLLPGWVNALVQLVLGLLVVATPLFYTALPGWAGQRGWNDSSTGIQQIGVGVRNGLAYYINPYKRGDDSAYQFGITTVEKLPRDSLVIAQWYTDTDEYFLLRYFTNVQPVRRDVTVIGWATQDPFSFDSRIVLDVIEESFPERPVYLASLSDRFYAASTLLETYCIRPEHNLYRLYPRTGSEGDCLGRMAATD
jgi:hypothetical protein